MIQFPHHRIGRRQFLRLTAVPAGAVVLASLPSSPAAASSTAGIDNVLIETSWRRRTLRLRIDYHLPQAVPSAAFAVQVSELDGTVSGLPAGLTLLSNSGPTVGTVRQSVTLPWPEPHEWDVNAPYLYMASVSLVDQSGQVVAAYQPIRFGFREVWTAGRDLILNGHPIKLRVAPFWIQNLANMTFYTTMGCNAIEFQPDLWGNTIATGLEQAGSQQMFDAADENGWGVLMPVPSINSIRTQIAAGDEDVISQWLGLFWQAARQYDRQNRPSILAWLPSINLAGQGDSAPIPYNPANLGKRLPPELTPPYIAATEQLIRLQDPTRLVIHHDGGAVGDADYANWYLNFTPLQEREDWLSEWASNGDMPFGAAEIDIPYFGNFFKARFGPGKDGIPYHTEWYASYLGDDAYGQEKDPYIDAILATEKVTGSGDAYGIVFLSKGYLAQIGDWTAHYDFERMNIRGIVKSYRAWGMNLGLHVIGDLPPAGGLNLGTPVGQFPPATPNSIYYDYAATQQPLLTYLGGPPDHFTGKDHDYRSGEPIQKTIVVVWDGPGGNQVGADWVLTVSNQVVASGHEDFDLTPGTVEQRAIAFTAPPVTEKTTGTLTLSVTAASGSPPPSPADTQQLSFFPPGTPAGPTRSRWAIYDPAGLTTAELAKLSVQPEPVGPGSDLSRFDVLVVGTRALNATSPLPFGTSDLQRGLRVVIFEQTAEALGAMGLRSITAVPRFVFPRASSHPVLAGVDPADLLNWRGAGSLVPAQLGDANTWPYPDRRLHWQNYGSVASVVIETPHLGAFTPLLETEFDLAYTPLLEWQHASGTVLFAQLDITGRIGIEPAADHLAGNIISYLDLPPARAPRGGLAYIGNDTEELSLLTGLGFEVSQVQPVDLPGSAGMATVQKSQVLVLGKGVVPGLPASAQNVLQAAVRAGATVIFLPRPASEFGSTTWPWSLSTASSRLARILPDPQSAADPLLSGIGPQLLRWRSYLDLDLIQPASLPDGARLLLQGLVMAAPDGQGTWVACQHDWGQLDAGGNNTRRPRWNARKFYRQLLTNSGAETGSGLAALLLPAGQRAALATIGEWRVAASSQEVPSGGFFIGGGRNFFDLHGLAPVYQSTAPWPGTTSPGWGTVLAADEHGFVDLTKVFTAADDGTTAYARTYIYASEARSANFALGAGTWMALRVNGDLVVDNSADGKLFPDDYAFFDSDPVQMRIVVPLTRGWNTLEIMVTSGFAFVGYYGVDVPIQLGFFAQVDDPGDLAVDPADTTPGSPPSQSSAGPLRSVAPWEMWYTEPLPQPEHVYSFIHW